METIIQKIDPELFENEQLDAACEILQHQGLVAFPTETVYGLGGDALDLQAANKIYQAKGRPSDNPLIIHIGEFSDLETIVSHIPDKSKQLAQAFWPGPLTMIFSKKEIVPPSTTGGLETVAVRMPGHPIALELIRRSGVLIAAPSANTSGRPSPTKAEHVIEDLAGRIDYIIDGGTVGIGLESTIIDMTTEVPMILRPGMITKEMLEEVIGTVSIDPVVESRSMLPDVAPKAPGMKYRHYAPKGQLTIVAGPADQVVSYINRELAFLQEKGHSVAVIAARETIQNYPEALRYSIGSRRCEGSIAAGLYDILRHMDDIGAEYIFSESYEDDSMGQAIMNRMLKAAGYHFVQLPQ